MAASGIAEHNEARRKERTLQRLAFKKKQLLEELENSPDLGAPAVDTYAEEVNQMRRTGSPMGNAGSGRHDPAYVDQMRRNQLRQQQLCEYSAKIPHRFSSTDYVAQW